MTDFTKEFFQRTWGPKGYYENFSYGVGYKKVYEICVMPFLGGNVLEIGCGGGTFTMLMIGKCNLTCIDVIKKPFDLPVNYIELGCQDYQCSGVLDESKDFVFAYNIFCHLSNEALIQYIKSVYRVLKPLGDFVFMLSSYGASYSGELGTLLPMGHFAQDDRTIDIVVGKEWQIVSRNMIPEHRDIIVHLKKPL
jgi:SAM-dependent methyltransferase